MGSCCSTLVPKYVNHIDALFPLATEVKTLGGVLQQNDVTLWKLRVSPADMTAYARQMPEKLAPMGVYLHKKIKQELQRGRIRSIQKRETKRGEKKCETHSSVCV